MALKKEISGSTFFASGFFCAAGSDLDNRFEGVMPFNLPAALFLGDK
jgi:hypothetical protein